MSKATWGNGLESFLLKEVMRIIELPGEDYTDGDCLDLIIELFEKYGLEFNWGARKGKVR